MNGRLRFDPADEVVARAAWSRLAEPGDTVAAVLVGVLGAGEALRWAHAAAGGPETAERAAAELLGVGGFGSDVRRLVRAVGRWAPRLEGLDPRRELRVLERLGGVLLHPTHPGWPPGLDDLGTATPPCLWVRGDADLAGLLVRSVALVGARASTAYGDRVAADLGAGVAERSTTVVSGGAYGIDAAAHRGCLAVPGRTVALLAGGVDRPYPAGNAALLDRVGADGGAVVSEVPPGSAPTRSRFLLRNRLIAALSRATVVVEAAHRSGALSTAAHAAALLRPVGAVPGPVTSMASAGCHRLLREGAAVCVTDAAEVVELAGTMGADLTPEPDVPISEGDGLDDVLRRVLESLPLRRGASVDAVARTAGLGTGETRGALGALELGGLAQRVSGSWRRTPGAHSR